MGAFAVAEEEAEETSGDPFSASVLVEESGDETGVEGPFEVEVGDRLDSPRDFAEEGWIVRGGGESGLEGFDDGVVRAVFEFLFGVETDPLFGGLEEGDEIGDGLGGEVDARGRFAAFGGEPPDAAVGVVAAFVAEVDLAVLDDRVVPVGDVECAVGAHLEVDGAERAVGAGDDVAELLGGEAGGVVGDLEAIDAVAAEVAGDEIALPFGREVAAADDFETAVLGLAWVEAAEDAGELVREADERGSREGIIDALAVSAVGDEALAP